jgi:hypothetical protein
MNWRKVLLKAAVTSLQAATAVLLGNGIDFVDLSSWQAAGLGALSGLVTFVHRTSTEWLDSQENAVPGPIRRRVLRARRIPEADPGAP